MSQTTIEKTDKRVLDLLADEMIVTAVAKLLEAERRVAAAYIETRDAADNAGRTEARKRAHFARDDQRRALNAIERRIGLLARDIAREEAQL